MPDNREARNGRHADRSSSRARSTDRSGHVARGDEPSKPMKGRFVQPDDHSLGLFPSPRMAAAAITMTRPWVARTTAEDKPERSQQ